MACKGKVRLENTQSYESEPMNISKSKKDVIHGEVSHHIQSPMKEANTVIRSDPKGL